MTIIPARLLRHAAEACRSRPPPTRRDQDRDVYIMEAARNAFVQNGRAGVSIPQFAYATGLSAVTLRRHISDVHHLFAMVLTEHLLAINQAVASVSRAGDDLFVRRRAAYFRATRGVFSVPTPVHFLLLRDRFTLPPDELEPIERLRRTIGIMLGGPITEATLDLLDNAYLNLGQIEALVATLDTLQQPRAGIPHRRAAPARREPDPPPPALAPVLAPALAPVLAPVAAPPPKPPAWADNALADIPDSALQTTPRPTQENPPNGPAAPPGDARTAWNEAIPRHHSAQRSTGTDVGSGGDGASPAAFPAGTPATPHANNDLPFRAPLG